jgi:hypothetical protein
MAETKIKISSIVKNQLPQYVREEYPLISEFLSQYYTALESQGSTLDIIKNISEYIKVDNLTNLVSFCGLATDVSYFDTTISVDSTAGFPDTYGLIKIDSEIISYKSKTETSFIDCTRGFSGIESHQSDLESDLLVFSTSTVGFHTYINDDSTPRSVENLSILFLKEFLRKIKKQITPGFEDVTFTEGLDEKVFIKQVKDFYSSKGTDESFKILFKALYGEKVEVVKPRDYLIKPSDAQYRVGKELVVESISGDPSNLVNQTIYQDQTDIFNKATGAVYNVEKILRGEKTYYIISLDYDYDKDINVSGSIFGQFSIHPNTQIVEYVSVNANTINVDSTAGFPPSGFLTVTLTNGATFDIKYTSKTLNQFFGCSGIIQELSAGQQIRINSYAYGYNSSNLNEIITFRVTGVLSDLDIIDQTYLYEKNDRIEIKTLGISSDDIKENNWIFNISQSYNIKSVSLLDVSSYTYRITTYDNNSLNIGDSITFTSNIGTKINATVYSYENTTSFIVRSEKLLSSSYTYIAKRNISKVNCLNYSSLNKYTSNVQNVYLDPKSTSFYVASPSLPTYLNQSLTINDKSITFYGSFDSDGNLLLRNSSGVPIKHSFYTGDSIVYTPNNISQQLKKGLYFVKKIDENTIRLSYSRNNIFANSFITLGGAMDGKIEFSNFTYQNLKSQTLSSQKLIRKLTPPENNSNIYETIPGATGIFVNGVELLNYKSKDNVYYGPIEKIIPTSPGKNYDVINPPIMIISDQIGYGATARCSVTGSLTRLDIIDPGFDYLEEPKIIIKGGNGKNASAKARLISFQHSTSFNSEVNAQSVDLENNIIGFGSYHKFRDYEEVIYITNGQTAVSGLSTNSTYFVRPEDAYKVKLYKSFQDSISGINTIQLFDYGIGNHYLRSKINKKKIGSITISNSGSGYQNNNIIVSSLSGINTASNTIVATNHGFDSGDFITYNATDISIGGLSSSTTYYVTRVNNDEFRLSEVGVGTASIISGINTTSEDFYYKTKQYVDLTSVGTSNHIFNYVPITVQVKGNIGVSTVYGQSFDAILRPIFRGSITSVILDSGGSSYGSEDIINFNRQPNFSLDSGEGALLQPVINNGQIVDVLIQSVGYNYNSIPDLQIIGSGSGAILIAIIDSDYGTLEDVQIVYGGGGYTKGDTFINVVSAGMDAEFEAKIQTWKINTVERTIQNSQITDDDGILDSGLDNNYGLQYTHAYAPRKLRSSVLATKYINGSLSYTADLQLFNGKEIDSSYHSPIIGWAYDGNPIYGPYGYSTKDGGYIKSMSSSYYESIQPGRPSISLYGLGFFIQDWQYIATSGDLDEYNGRFCKTPEYPNGTYAYFCTVNNGPPETDGSFSRYKKPIFPYVIGNYYKSKPIDFNFDKNSNQDDIDINSTGWLRNTKPYNLLNSNSGYDYIFNPNSIKKQTSEIRSVNTGKIDYIGVVTGGFNYKVDDKVIFDNKNSSGRGVSAKVSSIAGKNISQVSTATSIIDYIEFIPSSPTGTFIGFSTIPHNFSNNDIVSFTGFYDYKKSGSIKTSKNNLILRTGVGTTGITGIVTYFDVYGSLNFPDIRENDVYQIADEKVKVLNIDPQTSRIKVLRCQNGTSAISSYFSGIGITEITRKLSLNFGGITSSYNFNYNREFYFYPKESVGLGTTSGVGIAYTLRISNPGVGASLITIPTQTIYLPNHELDTGTELIYSSNGGNRISVSTNGTSTFQLPDKSSVYVAKISNNLIGISTIPVGLNSNGNFIGIGTIPASLLYLTSVGSGSTHSFKTNYDEILSGDLKKNIVTVYTSEDPGLNLNDKIVMNLSPGITTTISVVYDDYNRRVCFNPRNFAASDVDINHNTITIPSHNFIEGQKIIHKSISPCGGLSVDGIYYVVIVDSNKIKLTESYYKATKQNPPIEVNITSTSYGKILAINPLLKVVKNHTVKFDLSDSSLSYSRNSVLFSAFDLNLYKDSKFKKKFEISEGSSAFEVIKIGRVGIDPTAAVYLNVNANTPQKLYYKLEPINLDNNFPVKKEIIVDDDSIVSNNKISLVDSIYNGSHSVVGISTTSFSYNILSVPEVYNYSSSDGNLEYHTNSLYASGKIYAINLLSKGQNYKSLPSLLGVQSDTGYGAILEIKTNSIGKINKLKLLDIGFDYPSDLTIRPSAKIPNLIKIESLYSFDSIGISSVGKNYTTSPTLVVIDGYTNKVISDLQLKYNLKNNYVTIRKNTTQLYNTTPKIIPTNNSNGVAIKSINYDKNNQNVTVTLSPSFSDRDKFPFEVGDRVLIEHVSVGIKTTGKGYNSEKYNYSLFVINNVDSNLGGAGATVSYSLANYLNSNEFPGSFNSNNSSGIIVPAKYFPTFNPILKRNNFNSGEIVSSPTSTGTVNTWNPNSNYLKVSELSNQFYVGELITGSSSKTKGIISEIVRFNSIYNVKASTIKEEGWNLNTGFLSDDQQRMPDNYYYQNFSYSLKSKVPFDTWDNSVSKLNHTAGFKKFSNLILESHPTPTEDNQYIGINTYQNNGNFSSLVDAIGYVDVNCIYDFDLVKEKTFGGIEKSDGLIFNSRILQDYSESIGNRVLILDDISESFNSNPRPTKYVSVDSFNLNISRSKKYLAFIQDRTDITNRQLNLVTLIQNNKYGFLSQYSTIPTKNILGSFDFSISGDIGSLDFYPILSAINNYDVSTISIDLSDTISGVGTTTLGNIAKIDTSTYVIPSGSGISSSLPIIGISTSYRASKILISIGAEDKSYFEYNEISVIHDGTNVNILEYGKLTSDNLGFTQSAGLGTYSAHISGSNLYVDFIPRSTLSKNYNVNSARISIGNSSTTTTGFILLNNSELQSFYTSIAASGSPSNTIVANYSHSYYQGAYFVVCVEDKTNNKSQISEIVLGDNDSLIYVNQFAITSTNYASVSSFGEFTASIVGTTVNLYFTPEKNIAVEVRVLKFTIGGYNNLTNVSSVNLNTNFINSNNAFYIGNELDIKKQFNLTCFGNPVFKRYFDGSSSTIVDLTKNIFNIPNHYFTPGEKITYSYGDPFLYSPIGIATTSISGISTDKLPSTLYIIKVDENSVRVAASATDALTFTPIPLDIASVGIGTLHSFGAINQNSKSLITIDNVIQSPIVSTAVTTTLLGNIGIANDVIGFSGITSFYGGDLIQIDDEIMKINSIGIGSTNYILVQRPWLGSGIATHSSGSIIRKITGNYNIVDNIITFAEAPYGKIIFNNPFNKPDEIDYTGLATHSTFSGRIFLRSGIPNSINDAYYGNYIFDDLSGKFTGFQTAFALTYKNSNITGIYQNNGIITINDIFQGPTETGTLKITEQYYLTENSGITSITFTGTATSVTYDVNNSKVPRGGVIVTIGSTQGFGYQPLVSAGGTAVVSSAGTIQSISIGNSGSGYRSGIQTVNVSIQTPNPYGVSISTVGVASISSGRVISVKITNAGTGYTNYYAFNSTTLSSVVSIGSTVIPLTNLSGVIVGNYISVGAALTNVQIVGVGSTAITIGTGNTIKTSITSSTSAILKYYNPPVVVFDAPSSYSNVPLIYSSKSRPGNGIGAKANIVVGQGSSVLSFEMLNYGFGYGHQEILTVAIGGTTGIPTDTSKTFNEFQISVDKVFSDRFTGWTFGQLQVLDPLDDLFDGYRTTFPITLNNQKLSIIAKNKSLIDVKANLLIFINDILQVPGVGYQFTGGSNITFTEAPNGATEDGYFNGDTCKILFYKGTPNVDTIDNDILEPLEVGDSVTVTGIPLSLQEDERSVTDIIATDEIKTNVYGGPGITTNSSLLRAVTVCRQTEDQILNGLYVGKSRNLYEPLIYPNTNIIQNVGSASSIIFVESVKTFFDNNHENTGTVYPSKIRILSQDSLVSSSATAVVSIAGTISSIIISDGGVGYSTVPSVKIGDSVGFGTTATATATATINSSGQVTSINIINSGAGYTYSDPPSVLISPPPVVDDIISNVSYAGDFGKITQIRQVSVAGVASTGLYLDLFIPIDSPLRDSTINGIGITISGIQTGYYFIINNSKVGNGCTSIRLDGSSVGSATSCIDTVYQVLDVKTIQKNIIGVGTTAITQVLIGLTTYYGYDFGLRTFDSTIVTFDSTYTLMSTFDSRPIYYGNYSWGKITTPPRLDGNSYNFYGNGGTIGITTSAIVRRYNPLRYLNYN